MDTTPPFAASSDYVGLKEELQKIAGIIEQYPDQLKQRAFDLLINAYLGSNNAIEAPAPVQEQPADQAEGTVAAEAMAAEVSEASVEIGETSAGSEISDNSLERGRYSPAPEPESPLAGVDDTAANLLRKRIRLRSMSPIRWQTPA